MIGVLIAVGGVAASPARSQSVPSPHEARVVISCQEYEKARSTNEFWLLTSAGSVGSENPHRREGVVGVRLFAIKRGSFADRLGLRNGDLLQRINDSEVRSVSDLVDATARAAGRRDQNLDLLRDNVLTRITITCDDSTPAHNSHSVPPVAPPTSSASAPEPVIRAAPAGAGASPGRTPEK